MKWFHLFKDQTLIIYDNYVSPSPENCRWVTNKETSWNKSNNKMIEIDGVTKSLPIWADEFKIDQQLFRDRLKRGWPAKLSLTAPKGFKYVATESK